MKHREADQCAKVTVAKRGSRLAVAVGQVLLPPWWFLIYLTQTKIGIFGFVHLLIQTSTSWFRFLYFITLINGQSGFWGKNVDKCGSKWSVLRGDGVEANLSGEGGRDGCHVNLA